MNVLKIAAKSSGSAPPQTLYVEDVFAATLHYGNGTYQSVTTGITTGYRPTTQTFVVYENVGDTAALSFTYNAQAGDILVCYFTSVSGTRSLTVDGSSVTASSTFTSTSPAYDYAVYISTLSAGSRSIVTGNPGNGYVHCAVIRGASSITVGQVIGEAAAIREGNTTGFASSGFGLVLLSTQSAPADPKAAGGILVSSATSTFFGGGFVAFSGDGSNVPATTFYNVGSSYKSVFCVLNVAGLGATLSSEGNAGALWIRNRAAYPAYFYDSIGGVLNKIQPNVTTGRTQSLSSLLNFNDGGFEVGSVAEVNNSSNSIVSWSFKKQSKFFDLVSYTGTGSARTVSHDLGSEPGMIIVKRTDTSGAWWVYHRSGGATQYLDFSTNAAAVTSSTAWNDTAPTSSVFSVGTASEVNANGGTYIAYLFAHDAGGFGEDGTESIVSCGSYTGNGSATGPVISIGWEPQFLLIKSLSGATGLWFPADNLRTISAFGGASARLFMSDASAEASATYVNVLPDGFSVVESGNTTNTASATYMYLAIRRGPMKVPELGTEVFSPTAYTSTNVDGRLVDTGIHTDMVITRPRTIASQANYSVLVADRLRGNYFWGPISSAVVTDADTFMAPSNGLRGPFDANVGYGVGNDATYDLNYLTQTVISWAFKRAPKFFEMLTYIGTGSARSIAHNLKVVPELMIVKRLQTDTVTPVYVSSLGAGNYLSLGATDASTASATVWDNTTPTSSVFYVNNNSITNASGGTFVAYLFASLDGISKVGTYTGNGSSQTINCGFSVGSRFFMVKRTDSTGDWYVYDSARGIVSGNDPQLRVNNTAAEGTTFDAVDPDSSGIIVNNDATNFPINVNGATYIYFAIS